MLAEDRLNAIVSMVQQTGSVTVPELAEALGVTASTIRRDLQTLDRAHRIAKVHGGATSLERAHVTRDLTLNERSDLHNDDKERICARAAGTCGARELCIHRLGFDDAQAHRASSTP